MAHMLPLWQIGAALSASLSCDILPQARIEKTTDLGCYILHGLHGMRLAVWNARK
jgi:succinate dehydrogenase/fumarate reductase cytochrome b subunit